MEKALEEKAKRLAAIEAQLKQHDARLSDVQSEHYALLAKVTVEVS